VWFSAGRGGLIGCDLGIFGGANLAQRRSGKLGDGCEV
jgi:hypothetical protein